MAGGRLNTIFARRPETRNGFNEVSQLWWLRNRERQIASFDFATLRFRRRAREVYISELLSPTARMPAQITSVFARLETALVASRRLRYINGRNDYFSSRRDVRNVTYGCFAYYRLINRGVYTVNMPLDALVARVNRCSFYISSFRRGYTSDRLRRMKSLTI